jgi:hypothetical protein
MIRALMAFAFLLALPAAAAAQPYVGTSTPHRGTFEVSGAGTWTRGYDAGGGPANETSNTTTGGAPLTLFSVSARVQSGPGAALRLGLYLAQGVSIEASFDYSRPILRAHLTNDFEQAPDVDADETITSYLAGGSILYHFGSGHFVPFVSGGGGYLRQLHEENAELLTGTEIHAGGGVKYWLGTGKHRFGLRVDAQASSRSKSVAFEQKRRILPSAGAGIAFLF